MEALLRWRHPTKGLLLPWAFMAALETSSSALPVGWWVLDEACRQAAAWRDAGLPPLRIGVNLFPAQFRSAALVDHVSDALSRYGMDPGLLELEMVESIVIQQDDQALAAIENIRERGVRIAFDDFGTGYASLSTLKRYPITTLKIDRSFVRDLDSNDADAAITRAILLMGRELGLETVAEGIETAEQEAALRALGCATGQGFRYAQAMPPAAFVRFARGLGHAGSETGAARA